MAGNFGKLERTQNKHAAGVDRAIAREKKLKEQGLWKEPLHWSKEPVPKSWAEKNFKERYPRFVIWELRLEEAATMGVDKMLSELRDYCGYDKEPQQAYNWFKKMHADEVEPRVAWSVIKNKLGWE